MNLIEFGWNITFQDHFLKSTVQGGIPARITAENRGKYILNTGSAQLQAEVTGAFRHMCLHDSDFPKVGDFVVITMFDADKALIHAVLPRANTLSRKKAGTDFAEQVMAANITVICVVMGLDHDLNIRRLERYVAMAAGMACRLIVILNKADLIARDAIPLSEVQQSIGHHELFLISALKPEDITPIRQAFHSGDTVIFLGSSGVGKSTIVNILCGDEIQKTAEVREDDSRGRHTTTSRQLFVIDPGICIIDTPGMRELQAWVDDQEAIDSGFEDIDAITAHCRFNDCKHNGEPGCAVAEALANGVLTVPRWENYIKLCREREFLAAKVKGDIYRARKEKDKKLSKLVKSVKKVKGHKFGR